MLTYIRNTYTNIMKQNWIVSKINIQNCDINHQKHKYLFIETNPVNKIWNGVWVYGFYCYILLTVWHFIKFFCFSYALPLHYSITFILYPLIWRILKDLSYFCFHWILSISVLQWMVFGWRPFVKCFLLRLTTIRLNRLFTVCIVCQLLVFPFVCILLLSASLTDPTQLQCTFTHHSFFVRH